MGATPADRRPAGARGPGDTVARWGRRAALSAVALGAVVTVAMAALGPDRPAGRPGPTPAPHEVQPVGVAARDPLTTAVTALQDRLRTQPTDDGAWAQLGQAYLQQARLTADPSYYGKAATALSTSLRLRPTDNGDALAGEATLAAGQHEFARALHLADQVLALNPYSAGALGIKTDALTELGRYADARVSVQRMLDLHPGVDSFARASYQYELRGQLDQARFAMQRAADEAGVAADRAFALHYLGELAFNRGDPATSLQEEQAALAVDPTYVPAVAGRARSLAAQGDTAGALAGYRDAVSRQPQPAYVVALAELLAADGQDAAARVQYAVVRATEQLFVAQGSNVDLELALFEADHGAPSVALGYARSAYAARPASVLVQDAYAWALHRSGQDAQALPIARSALATGFVSAAFRYHLAVVEAAVGDRAGARADLTKALTLSPGFNPLQVTSARTLLASLA